MKLRCNNCSLTSKKFIGNDCFTGFIFHYTNDDMETFRHHGILRKGGIHWWFPKYGGIEAFVVLKSNSVWDDMTQRFCNCNWQCWTRMMGLLIQGNIVIFLSPEFLWGSYHEAALTTRGPFHPVACGCTRTIDKELIRTGFTELINAVLLLDIWGIFNTEIRLTFLFLLLYSGVKYKFTFH